MAKTTDLSWAQLDEEIKSNKGATPLVVRDGRAVPDSGADTVIPLRQNEVASKTLLSDWTRVLDGINEASARAEEREKRLAAQASAHHQTLSDLRAELRQAREEVRVAAVRAQAQLAEAEERMRVSKERARAAEARAEHAETWLARIADAVGTLLIRETSALGTPTAPKVRP
ncbi:hypothetical protein [uncultured Methylobacterium sp.]|uniref:hypothetical protein n=1 Tax=uncultured Methylobacterium sp. TaxID=157278 RepID=UPI0025940223|nr:hypothetical protein [uncultured Methylobacterium sp.]